MHWHWRHGSSKVNGNITLVKRPFFARARSLEHCIHGRGHRDLIKARPQNSGCIYARPNQGLTYKSHGDSLTVYKLAIINVGNELQERAANYSTFTDSYAFSVKKPIIFEHYIYIFLLIFPLHRVTMMAHCAPVDIADILLQFSI